MDQDLITYARDCVSRGEDLFKLLDVDATSSESDIRRAFRKKALTAHPDKAGDAYDPALYARLEKGRDVLVNPEAREAYDNGMRAILQKKQALDAMSARRRKLVEDLEQREQEAANKKKKTEDDSRQRSAEMAAMAARGRAKMEERKRLIREAEERERLREEAEKKARGVVEDVAPTAGGGIADTATGTSLGEEAVGDEDPQIADLERRLREAQKRKAEKKQRKEEKRAAKKNGGEPQMAAREELQTSATTSLKPPPPPAATTDSKTDATSSNTPTSAGNTPSPPTTNASSTTAGGGGFPALMARLKAAQAKKEEEKRRAAAAS
ncbi:hypothetical protein V8F20_009338 [Naviculisporaceae sp. PSN 640]